MGQPSASFSRKCAPPQDPVTDIANYDQLSYRQSHELRKQRGYNEKDTRAAPRTRTAAVDATNKKNSEGR